MLSYRVKHNPLLKSYLRQQGYHFVRTVKISEDEYDKHSRIATAHHPEEKLEEIHARVLYRHIGLTRDVRWHRLGKLLLQVIPVILMLLLALYFVHAR